MVPVATAPIGGGLLIVNPVVVHGDDESLLDHVGFVGIAIRGGGQVRGVQADFIVGIDGLALFHRVSFRHSVLGTDALDVVHDVQSLLT